MAIAEVAWEKEKQHQVLRDRTITISKTKN